MPTCEQCSALARYDTCTLANAIEMLDLRLRNEGFTHPGLACRTGLYPATVGHAVTVKVKTADAPTMGQSYFDRTDLWNLILTTPAPRVAVIEDIDQPPGVGAYIGEIHANIFRALDCQAVVTNGSVRDLDAAEAMSYPLYSCSVSPSHAYTHITELGVPVQVCALEVKQGDLVAVDRHGMITLPPTGLEHVLEAAARLTEREREVIDICRQPHFNAGKLREALWRL